jgi:hypothetical protein
MDEYFIAFARNVLKIKDKIAREPVIRKPELAALQLLLW